MDKGCTLLHNATRCEAAGRTDQGCVWVPQKGHTDAYCTNIDQMKNALCLVNVVLALAIPAWGIVAVRRRRMALAADAAALTAVDPANADTRPLSTVAACE
jgi:hypothetical protein